MSIPSETGNRTNLERLLAQAGGVSGVIYSSLPVVTFVAASNLFGLLPWHVPHDFSSLGIVAGIVAAVAHLGVWPILMGLTMFLQQKLNPPPPDPVQARIFMFLPIVFTFTLANFPAGLVIYWAWNNLLSIAQQWVIMRRVNAPAATPAK